MSTTTLPFRKAEPLLGELKTWNPPAGFSLSSNDSSAMDNLANALKMKVSATTMVHSFKLAMGATEIIGGLVTDMSPATESYSSGKNKLGKQMDMYL